MTYLIQWMIILGNLFTEAESIAHRSSNLQARIDRIAVRVTQLDSTVEEGKFVKSDIAPEIINYVVS